MRIYGKFEDISPDDYEEWALSEISTKPFTIGLCKYLDIEEDKCYDCSEGGGECWKVYNGEICMGEYLYNPKTKEYINSRIVGGCIGIDTHVTLEDGRRFDEDGYDGEYCTYAGGYESEWKMYQTYKNGKPVGEPRFEVL